MKHSLESDKNHKLWTEGEVELNEVCEFLQISIVFSSWIISKKPTTSNIVKETIEIKNK